MQVPGSDNAGPGSGILWPKLMSKDNNTFKEKERKQPNVGVQPYNVGYFHFRAYSLFKVRVIDQSVNEVPISTDKF